MRSTGSTTRLKVTLAAGTVAILGVGVATGAYAFSGSNTTQLVPAPATPSVATANQLVPAPATPAVAVTKPVVRRVSVRATKRATVVRRAPALSLYEGKLSLDDGLFKLKVMHIVGARNSQASWQLYEHRAALDIGPRVPLVDWRGGHVSPALVDDAIVRVYGRLLPTSAWRWTDDGPRPVIRAQRIVILRFDPDFGD